MSAKVCLAQSMALRRCSGLRRIAYSQVEECSVLESRPLDILATCSSRLREAVDIHISWSMDHEVASYQQLGLGTG